MANPKKPAPHFTEDVKNVLTGLAHKYQKILECKKTNIASLSVGAETWKRVCSDYNSNYGVHPRDDKQLKKC